MVSLLDAAIPAAPYGAYEKAVTLPDSESTSHNCASEKTIVSPAVTVSPVLQPKPKRKMLLALDGTNRIAYLVPGWGIVDAILSACVPEETPDAASSHRVLIAPWLAT